MSHVSMIDGHIDETNVEKFVRLVTENPNLPVIPMVDYEVVGDAWGRWVGSFGYCYIGEYTVYQDHYYTDREDFKEEYFNWNDEELCKQFNYNYLITEYATSRGVYTEEQLKANNENEKKMDKYLDKIADGYFIKAIIVCIDLPEV